MFSTKSVYQLRQRTNKFVVGKLLSLVFLVFMSVCCHAQEQESQKNNLVLFEVGGVSYDGVAFGYERYIHLGRLFKASARGGSAFAGEKPAVAPFIGNSILFGKQSYLEFGLNILFHYKDIETDIIYDFPANYDNGPLSVSNSEKVVHKNLFHFLLGYRLQTKRGFMFRVFVTLPNQLNIWGYPGGGISFGMAL